MGVFPADHVITKGSRFVRMLRPAFKAAEQGRIAVLGIQPRWAETGYGYIEFAPGITVGSPHPQPVRSFREKPDPRTAKKFLAAGRFFWNAGMFFWRTDVVMDALRQHLPKTWTLLAGLPPFGHRDFNSRVAQVFPLCENVSIDYAVIEKANNIVGLAMDDIGWSDVGSWDAVYELLPRDSNGNAAVSDVLLEDSQGNYVDGRGKLIALVGVKNLIVVDTPDALLISDRSRAQKIGDVVKALEKRGRTDLL
jgi:mannose-1-phosphate guanylyltransferase